MLCPYIRSSSYGQYDYCQMSYFITYVLGHSSDSGKKAELGTIVHKVMEIMARLKQFSQENPSKKFLEIEEEVVKKVKVHQDEFLKTEIIDEILDIAYAFYTASSKHAYTKGDKETCRKLINQAVEFNGGQFDPRLRDIVEVETYFDIPIEEEWATFERKTADGKTIKGQLAIKGTIDLVTKADEGIIEVIDWKTGRRLDWATGEEKDYNKLTNDVQLLLYNYALSKKYPEFKQIIMSIYFIKDGGPFSLCFDKSDHTKFLDKLKIRFKDIMSNNHPKPRALAIDRSSSSNWKCNKLCHFYKNNWPGTDQKMCMYIEDQIKSGGIEHTITNCSKPGFSTSFYEAPG